VRIFYWGASGWISPRAKILIEGVTRAPMRHARKIGKSSLLVI